VGTWQLKKANRQDGWLRFKRLFLKDKKKEEIAEIEEE
jgi:hypothetical protein